MTITNRLITIGMGVTRDVPERAGLVTMGMGGIPQVVIETIENIVRRRVGGGGGGTKNQLDDLQVVMVWAKLVELNGQVPLKPVSGSINVTLSNNSTKVVVEHVSRRVKQLWQNVKIIVKRLR